ncbi:MAG: deoxyribonuclease IV [Candidatus Moranbacteria bacterium]|nr:deoxyribonuclease IV [Candidatus Moranbacteria bacterium]
MNIGCHTPIVSAEIIDETPKRASDLGCETMQIFTRSPQGGGSTPLSPEACKAFESEMKKNNLKNLYVHAPFYINFASPNNRIRYGSAKAIREELERASLLGANYVITHLGSTKETNESKGIEACIKMIGKTLEGYTGKTQLLLENSAGAGSIIGDDLKELAQILEKANHSKLGGICLDTQHSFASGYDWNDFDKTIETIESEIGLENIKLIHVNDSKTDLGSKKDRHTHLGEGKIEIDSFKKIVNFAKERDLDLILETTHPRVKDDIALLKKLRSS